MNHMRNTNMQDVESRILNTRIVSKCLSTANISDSVVINKSDLNSMFSNLDVKRS